MTTARSIITDRYQLYLGDCYELLPAMASVDAIVTDPPYRFKTEGAGEFRKNRKYLDEIEDQDLHKGFDHRKVLTPARCDSCVVFCHNDQLHDLMPHLALSFHRHALLDWKKTNPMPFANKNYQADTEYYIHAWQPGAYPRGELKDKKRSWTGSSREEGQTKRVYDHPTVKPLGLMKKIITNVAGETILDPFMGTGTTGVAALQGGRRFIGIEVREKYFDIAAMRLAAAALTVEAT